MSWRDLFYFSKGERRALILLLCILSLIFLLLIITDTFRQTKEETLSPKEEAISFLPSDTTEIPTERTPSPKQTKGAEKSFSLKKKHTLNLRFTKDTRNSNKYPEGTVVELNGADTIALKKVPGIGTAFANRIVKYKNLLGGFHSVSQLQEVYGIDEEKYHELLPWFSADTSAIKKLEINRLPFDSLLRHPYIGYGQTQIIIQLRRQKGCLTGWENLHLFDEFTETDKARLLPYLSFK